jgi:hypothetical protein
MYRYVFKVKLDHLNKNLQKLYIFLVKKVRSGSGTIIPDPEPTGSGSGSTTMHIRLNTKVNGYASRFVAGA